MGTGDLTMPVAQDLHEILEGQHFLWSWMQTQSLELSIGFNPLAAEPSNLDKQLIAITHDSDVQRWASQSERGVSEVPLIVGLGFALQLETLHELRYFLRELLGQRHVTGKRRSV
jgi:hypothetical protein